MNTFFQQLKGFFTQISLIGYYYTGSVHSSEGSEGRYYEG